MVNTPTFLPDQTYITTDGFMKHVVVFVIDITDYALDDTVFCKVSPLCHEGYFAQFVMAKHLVKYEFFPEDEEI